MRKLSTIRTVLAGSASVAVIATSAFAGEFNVPSGDLRTALNLYAKQAGVELLYPVTAVEGGHTKGAKGDLSADAALAAILKGTGFTTHRTPSGAIGIVREVSRREETSLQLAQATPRPVAAAGIESVLVTAQKRTEDIQLVPIAVTALSNEQLQAQKIEGGPDLMKAMPNVTFSKNNFSGYNFSIRGIGTKAVSVTTDPGVAVDFNGTTLIRNRLFEQEYFDIERVEVLRGPQGTLYGRNATSGVINVISHKADLDEFSGSIKGEVGNYSARRATGVINIPIVEGKLAIRAAGSYTLRSGYNIDLYDNSRQDGRNLWSTRVTLGFSPIEQLHGDLVWEHFNENDDRARTGKQLCTHDAGPLNIGGVDMTSLSAAERGHFSQGCLPGSLYDDKAFGTPNGFAIPFIQALRLRALGTHPGGTIDSFVYPIPGDMDPYGNTTQSHDLRELYSQIKPTYRAKADVYELNFDLDVAPQLVLSSQTAYNSDKLYSSQDYNRYATLPVIADSASLVELGSSTPSRFKNFSPGGFFCDPQLGCSNTIIGQDISREHSKQFSQEFRVQSSYAGPFNFSAGVDYTRYRTVEDYYVFFNGITMATILDVNSIILFGGFDPSKNTTNPDCSALGIGFLQSGLPDGFLCIPIEQNSIANIQDTGRNYFLSRNPYTLTSKAAFGEVYWEATPTLKVTAGLRYTDDAKTFTPIPSETLLSDPDRGALAATRLGPMFTQVLLATPLFSFASSSTTQYPSLPDVHLGWKEVTGRLGVDWRPTLPFTDQTMLYASYSRGYKGGGMNPPRIGLNYDRLDAAGIVLAPTAPLNFRPEFVNAFEVGAKNTLLDGSMTLNGDAFFYDYKDYQVSKIVDRSAQNENFNARIWGTEIESVWEVARGLRINTSLGYLDTKLAKGSKSIDVLNRTAGNPDWVVIKPFFILTSNCIAPAALVAKVLSAEHNGRNALDATTLCPGGAGFPGDDFRPGSNGEATYGFTYDPAQHPEANYGTGISSDVGGHELPNAPHFTVSLGAQYGYEFTENWVATLRGDFYWQSQQWARVYELPVDKLRAWKNANLRLTFDKSDSGLTIELYVKNVFNDTPITDTFTNSDDTALTTNIFVLDPRLIGFSVTKTF